MASPQQIFADLVSRFRPDAAEGLTAVYQLSLTGDEGGTWHLTIADKQCSLSEGPAERSDVAITMSADDWRELIAGRLDSVSAFMAGRILLIGDLDLVMRLQPVFGL